MPGSAITTAEAIHRWPLGLFNANVINMMSSATGLAQILQRRGIRDARVLDAIVSIDRARFVDEALAGQAWDDKALPIGSGQTISQPYIVALMSEALALAGGEIVLEVGTGSGYQAAVLSRLCRRVVSIERHPELSQRAGQVLAALGIDNVNLRIGDGTIGAADVAPFDGILVTAGAPNVPARLIEQLAPAGRMVIPVGDETAQELVLVRHGTEGPVHRHLCDCRFVPLIGAAGWEA